MYRKIRALLTIHTIHPGLQWPVDLGKYFSPGDRTMGGWGSGNRIFKKQTVESCLRMDIKDLRPKEWPSMGSLIWPLGNRDFTVFYTTEELFNAWLVSLDYSTWIPYRDIVPVSLTVITEDTYPHFGGRRSWFICPLCQEEHHRRVKCLYLPPKRLNFACRHCHQLTYLSSQESHKELDFSVTLEKFAHSIRGMSS